MANEAATRDRRKLAEIDAENARFTPKFRQSALRKAFLLDTRFKLLSSPPLFPLCIAGRSKSPLDGVAMAAESKTGDMFDAVTMLEERVFSDGIRSGLEMGTTSGFLEGQGLGLDRGFDLGQELGYIDGVVQALRAALADDELSDKLGKSGASPSPRLLSNLDKLEELVEAFPLENDKVGVWGRIWFCKWRPC
eukprot:scaffold1428_cov259-Pinguiococcus_pyrenoidosus.AAC.13